MFTGLIESTGILLSRHAEGNCGRLKIRAHRPFQLLEYGESIAVNGVCLTLEKSNSAGDELEFFTLNETLLRTNLGEIPPGGKVNLERAMLANHRFGGHLVSGHVDGTGKVLRSFRQGQEHILEVELPPSLAPFLAPKGSIALDGVSLTLVKLEEHFFSVHLIPVTLGETALPDRKPGDLLNLECDIIGKYVWRQLQLRNTSNVTWELLEQNGFLDK